MCALMQRQSTSSSGTVNNSSGTDGPTKQHVPVSQVITHNSDPAPAACTAPATAAGAPAHCCCRLWQRLWFKVLVAVLLLAAVAVAIAVPVAVSRAAARRRMLPPQHSLGPRLSTDSMALVFGEDFTQFDASSWNYDIGDGSDYGLNRWAGASSNLRKA